jgi:PhzF family phenazine biosynthesis protein
VGKERRVGFPLLQIDAFTDRPFAGNPAAVCLLPGPRDADWMQQVGGEMNLSETAFLCCEGDGHRLRWFTPKVEVDLCGHATLAAAHALWETGRLRPEEEARFHTRSGLLTVVRRGAWMEMDFPAKPPAPAAAPAGLAEALGATPRYVGRNQFDYLVEVESEEALRALAPDFKRLAELPVRGVIVTARATTTGFDFVSRFFAPSAGINEDPVTGSAHCCLGPFWREKLDKDEMRAYQVSARGGAVGVRVAGERVFLRGQAVTVLRGELVC